MSEWKEYKLGELIQSVSETYKFKQNEKVVFLNTSDILDGKFLTNSLSEASKLPGQAKKRIRKGDILFSEIRPANKRFALVNFDCDNYVVSTKLMVLRCNDNVDNRFIYNYLTSKDVLEYLQMVAEDRSGTFPQITFDIIANMDIELPSIEEQKQIGEILTSLDDKIDLLRCENATLEAMAETLFRQWFVVEAKEEWEEGKLGDYVDVVDNRGKTPPYIETVTKYPIIEVNALTGCERHVNYDVVRKYVTKEVKDTWFRGYIHKNDILISTVGSIGELAMCLEEKGVIAQNVIALHASNISSFYLYQYLLLNKDDLKGLDIGSVQPSIKVPHLLKMPILLPPIELMNRYDSVMTEIIDKETNNYKEIQTLIQTRDGLLPRLMSGEIKI